MWPDPGMWNTLLRLGVAVALGGLVGWNRERMQKPAGLRTHMLVSLGAASFIVLALEMGRGLPPESREGFDPCRGVQGRVGGIGFLCAGVILQVRGRIEGITTAAGLWIAGAIGAASGMGAYALAVFVALLSLVIIAVLGRFEDSIPKANMPTSTTDDSAREHDARKAARPPT